MIRRLTYRCEPKVIASGRGGSKRQCRRRTLLVGRALSSALGCKNFVESEVA